MKPVQTALSTVSMAAALFLASACNSAQSAASHPTIVLVHGAFADASSWNGAISILSHDGYPVVAAANPLRGVRSDADEIDSVIDSIHGPVVLVGHSYGGSVISEAAFGRQNVKALVFVSAFEPDAGETGAGLSSARPGATLGATLAPPVLLQGGGHDLYIQQDRFPAQFAADVPAAQAALMAATQRPILDAALSEPSTAPAWKTIPSWTIYGSADLNIPPAEMAFMAQRAHARRTVVINGGSHVIMVSHPNEVAALIEEAANAR